MSVEHARKHNAYHVSWRGRAALGLAAVAATGAALTSCSSPHNHAPPPQRQPQCTFDIIGFGTNGNYAHADTELTGVRYKSIITIAATALRPPNSTPPPHISEYADVGHSVVFPFKKGEYVQVYAAYGDFKTPGVPEPANPRHLPHGAHEVACVPSANVLPPASTPAIS